MEKVEAIHGIVESASGGKQHDSRRMIADYQMVGSIPKARRLNDDIDGV